MPLPLKLGTGGLQSPAVADALGGPSRAGGKEVRYVWSPIQGVETHSERELSPNKMQLIHLSSFGLGENQDLDVFEYPCSEITRAYSFNIHLLGTCCIPGLMLGAGPVEMNQNLSCGG